MAHLARKAGYGLGDMSSSMFWKIFSFYLPFFYSNIFGLELADAAMLMLVTRIWDSVSDPMMGIIADRTRSRWGKFRPYLLWGAVPFAACGVLLFTSIDSFTYGQKLIWAYVTYILMMTMYTVVNVPYGALLDVITPDSAEKTTYSSFRMFFAYIGSFAALLAWEPLLEAFGGGVSAWQGAMVVIATVCAILFVGCFALTREVAPPAPKAEVGKDILHLISNVPWWIMNGVAVGTNLFNIVRGSVVAYMFAYIISDNIHVAIIGFAVGAGVFLCIGEFANMFGVLMTSWLASRFGKKNVYIMSLVVMIAVSVPFYYIEPTMSGLWIMIWLQIFYSIALGVASPLIWSMYADVANYSQDKYGTASTGLIFSSASMAQKFGSAFGGAGALWLLAYFQFDANLTEQPAEALDGIMKMMSFVPAALAAVTAVIMSLFPLTTARMKEVNARLSAAQSGVQ